MDFRSLHRDLVEMYGRPERSDQTDAVRQLISTILSQNVAGSQTAQATRELFAAYPDYKSIEGADQDELAETISVAGLKNQKAARIQRSLERIREETGAYNLAFLDEMPSGEAQNWLTDIKGIGPKTANVVLNFHFEKPTFAVDTHIHRLANRFEMCDGSTRDTVHEELNAAVPDDLKYSLHVLMIRHGQEYCSAQNPDCDNPICEQYCKCEHC